MKGKRKIREWLIQAAENEEHKISILNYIFTSDEMLLQLNKQYLNHYTLTDIITFDLSEEPGRISADIYISIERARENARAYKEPFPREVRRLLIHGLLHLVGYTDKSREDSLKMRAREEYYLSLPVWE